MKKIDNVKITYGRPPVYINFECNDKGVDRDQCFQRHDDVEIYYTNVYNPRNPITKNSNEKLFEQLESLYKSHESTHQSNHISISEAKKLLIQSRVLKNASDELFNLFS